MGCVVKVVDENLPDVPEYQEVAANGSADRMVISGRLKTDSTTYFFFSCLVALYKNI